MFSNIRRSVSILAAALTAIFAFGVLPGTISATEIHETTHIPWSGYWWPFTDGGLSTGKGYRGHPAPLEKYEMLVNGQTRGLSVTWYENEYYKPGAVDWAGLCPAWARASAEESYEILPSSNNNIIFRVGDKKGLLTLCHDADLYLTGFGYKPEEFHLWLLQYIRDEKRAFTADLSPGEEVWYFPIYRYEMNSTRGALYESVTVTIYYARDDVFPDYMGTLERSKTYTYRLTYNTAGEIVDGEWTGASINSHPEIMRLSLSAQAANPYLDCDRIREIARSRDDFLELENNAAAAINPGTYHLVLLDSDDYILNALPEDEVYIEILKADGSLEDMAVSITDASGNQVVGPEILTAENPSFAIWITDPRPSYHLSLTQENYGLDPNIYTLTVDRKSPFQENVYCLPVAGQWSGFAVTNSNAESAKSVELVVYTNSGLPQQTLFGPVDIGVNEKKLFLLQDLPWRAHEYGELDFFKLNSDRKLDLVNLFAAPVSAMGGFGSRFVASSSRLVIPDTYYTLMGSGPYMKGSVLNESFLDAPVEIQLFTRDGDLVETILDSIEPGGVLQIRPGSQPFGNIPDGGWMDIVSTSGVKLSGYQYVREVFSTTNEIDTLPALPVFSRTQYVPHMPPPGSKWQTEVTLINPNSRENRIVFHFSRAGNDAAEDQTYVLLPFEKRRVDLTAEFAKTPGDALSQSILEISGDYTFVGYYAYSAKDGVRGDTAGFPLLSVASFKEVLILPHVPPGNGAWWTGVGICNPNDEFVDVLAEPYDGAGELMADLVKVILLDPGAYTVFDVRPFFDGTDADISFIKFKVAEDLDGVIGGFYLYGNSVKGVGEMDSLSGANM